jgi:hypothetical protein
VDEIIDPFASPAPASAPAQAEIIDPFSQTASDDDKSAFERVVDVGGEVGRGIITAPISLVQGLTELGAAGLDLALGTNTSRPVTEAFESVKSGIKPERMVGQAIEDITAFGIGFIPVAGWLGRASSAAKAAKAGKVIKPSTSRFLRSAENFGKTARGQALLSTRAGLIGTTAAAAAGYETIFTPDGRTTLSDAFDLGGPLQTEADTGLTGREEALRRIRNKLRAGAEAGLASAAFDTALVGLGAGVGAIGRTEAGSAAARGVRTGFDLLGTAARKLPGAKFVGRIGTKYLTPTGGADPRVYEEMMDTIARIDATEAGGIKAYGEYEQALNNTLGKLRLFGKGKDTAKQAEADLFRYLTGTGPDMSKYGEEVSKAADRLLGTSNKVREQFITAVERELATALPGAERTVKLQNALKAMNDHAQAEKGFLRRAFQVHKDPINYYKNIDLTGKDKQLYEEAVTEVARNLDVGSFGTPETLALARYKVNEYIGLGAINNGLSPKAAIGKMLDSIKAQQMDPKGGLYAKDMPRLKLTPTLLTPREAILDSSPKLRQLLGEVTDPKELYYQTIGDMAKTTEALRFYQNMATSGMVTSLADAIPKISGGLKPLFVQVPDTAAGLTDFDVSPFIQRARELNVRTMAPGAAGPDVPSQFAGQVGMQDVIDSYADELVQNGYVKLGESDKFSDVFTGAYGSLSGLYVAPETYQALTAPMRIGVTGIDEVLSILTQMRGLSQKMTIVPNPESQVRNILGNTAMLAATANLGRSTDIFDVFKLFTTNLDGLNEQGLERLSKVISLSGVTESSLVIKALQEYRDAGADLAVSGKLRNLITKAEGWVPFLQAFERLYSDSDSFFKGVAVVSEQNKLMKAFADAGLNRPVLGLLEDLQDQGLAKRVTSKANPELTPLEVMAADAVKDMFPIYNRVGLFVRELDKFPVFGNFMSFASENIRNSVNILDRGLREMSFTVSDRVRKRLGEETARKFERSIRAQGAQRLMAYTAVAGVIPKAAVRASMAATGTTPEQMEAMYAELPEFFAGNDIVVTQNDQNGKLQYINLSYTLPYAFAIDPAVAGIRAYNEAERLGKDEMEQIVNGIWASVTSYADPFSSQAMSTERVLDVLPRAMLGREGRTLTGSVVYNETDTLSQKVLSSINHLSATYMPGYAREIVEIRGGDIRPGRITRAMTDTPGPQGEEFNLPAEFARIVTGFTPMELNLKRDFQFAGKEYAPRRQDAKTAATRIIRAPDRTAEGMMNAWNQYLDNLYREQVKLYGDIQAARTLGLSDKEIRRNLIKEAKLGSDEVNTIMRGQFYPGRASEELMEDIRMQERAEKINRVTPTSAIPFREFMQASRARMRQELIPEEPVEAAPAAPSAPSGGIVDPFEGSPIVDPFSAPAGGGGGGSMSSQGAAVPPPAFDSMPAPSVPQLPTAPANRASLSPSLLGGDLASQMANMEIARRISGQ